MNAVFAMFSLFVATLVFTGLLGGGFVLIYIGNYWSGGSLAIISLPATNYVFGFLRDYLGF